MPVDDAKTFPKPSERRAKEFRDFSDRYRAVLDAVHRALDNPCRVPLKYDRTDIDLRRMQGVRQTARALIAEAGVASMIGDEEAASRLLPGYAPARRRLRPGRLVIHWLIGSALQGMGLYGVHEWRRFDDAVDATPMDWRASGAGGGLRVAWTRVAERDDIWSNHAYGWQGRLIHVLIARRTARGMLWAQC